MDNREKYGRLTVTEHLPNGKCKCVCECGNEVIALHRDVKRGHTKSCGCLQRERAKKAKTKHGESSSDNRLYTIWKGIKARCCNSNNPAYKNYGARGIQVCKEWLHDFTPFKEWALKNGYDDKLTLDRINNDGNYEPLNCRWVTRKEQCRNKRNNHFVEYNGERKTISEWSEELGIERTTITRWLKRGIGMQQLIASIQEKKMLESKNE